MAKRKLRAKRHAPRAINTGFAWHFIAPCVIGGAIAWVFTGSITLAVIVLFAVLIGNYVGYELVKNYK